jgi:thiamine biosynthesis lipoprotein
MEIFVFEGLGTKWKVCVDEVFSTEFKQAIKKKADRFEQIYSRFIESSTLCQLNKNKQNPIEVSAELINMLELGLRLEKLTESNFSLNIGSLMEAYGYDSSYSFKTDEKKIKNYQKGKFWLKNKWLYRKGDVCLDLGGIGKGYLVDKMASYLDKLGVRYYLISAGGDIFATSKRDGGAWRVAIEHPMETDKAVGVVELKNQALASSSAERRRVGSFHHLLNIELKKPADNLLAVSVLADDAMTADGASTAIFVSPKKLHKQIAKELKVEYLEITKGLEFQKTKEFRVVVF